MIGAGSGCPHRFMRHDETTEKCVRCGSYRPYRGGTPKDAAVVGEGE